MYPGRQLNALAVRKAGLRTRIARRRRQDGDALARLVRPLVLLDRLHALWRRAAPVLHAFALPAGLVLGRAGLPRSGFLGRVLRWSPLVITAWRGLTGAAGRRR